MMSNNIIWIAGAKGSLGQALRAKFKKPANTVLVSDTDVDITDLEAVLSYANINSPEWIINCAGITNPEECESDMTNAFKVNALGARNLAIAARQLNAVIIQISTDDVFSGRNEESLQNLTALILFLYMESQNWRGRNLLQVLIRNI